MKDFIRIFSLLSLVIVFTMAAKAQTVERFEAKIPFSFEVNGKSFEPGDYVLRMANAPSGKKISLETADNHVLEVFYVMERGDITKSPLLRFVRNDDKLTLARISTTEKSFGVAGVSMKPKNASVSDTASQTVSINLK